LSSHADYILCGLPVEIQYPLVTDCSYMVHLLQYYVSAMPYSDLQ